MLVYYARVYCRVGPLYCMAVELIDAPSIPQVHAVVTKDKGTFFHLPELAKVVVKKPMPSILRAIKYAVDHNTPLAEVSSVLVNNAASGLHVHDQMYAKGLITALDFSSKLIPTDSLPILLAHFDKENGASVANGLIAAAEKIVLDEEKPKPVKQPQIKEGTVPRLLDPQPATILQRKEMEQWATGDVSLRPNFKGVNKRVFDLYYDYGINPYLNYLHVVHKIPKSQLRLTLVGRVTVFDWEKIEGFDRYAKNIRKKDAFYHRVNQYKGLIMAAKYLTRSQPLEKFSMTKEQAFIKGLSSKCTELDTLARRQPKPVKSQVLLCCFCYLIKSI